MLGPPAKIGSYAVKTRRGTRMNKGKTTGRVKGTQPAVVTGHPRDTRRGWGDDRSKTSA